MLFNSYVFLLLFLPLVLALFALARRHAGWGGALGVLALASLFFYGWWEPRNLPILLVSMLANYALGLALERDRAVRPERARWLRNGGVALNLAALGVYKYPAFAIATWNDVSGASLTIPEVVLPLAISFFTFQQIAYLVDVARGRDAERSLLNYGVFVSFFPQLIAGPIVQYRDVRTFLQQAQAPALALGLSLFTVGLAKKVLLADTLAPHVKSAFGSAYVGSVDIWTAWSGLIAYTLQIYYDFSGYSDMALGLGLMFGLRLPINFYSPYKARNIADFWRRWHMTLSSFLRDYLYIPLGGNRGSAWRTARNLSLTMLLGGLWHGANWTFVVWGAWHGLMLVVHRFGSWIRMPALLASVLTLAGVMAGWLIFRSPDLQSAAVMASALVTPAALPPHYLDLGAQWPLYAALVLGILIAWRAPNTAQVFLDARLDHHEPAPGLRWQAGTGWMLTTAVLLACSIACLSRETEFLYFQF